MRPHQGEFAASIGITQGRQSLLERGERGISAEYLELVSNAGLDVGYIITGKHSAGALSQRDSDFIALLGSLPDYQADALLAYIRQLGAALADRTEIPASERPVNLMPPSVGAAMLQSPRNDFEGENEA